MVNPVRLLQLFHAYREQNDTSFRRAAEALISEETMANHHALANQLQKALGPARNGEGKIGKVRPLRGEQKASDGLLFFPRLGTEDMRVVFGGVRGHEGFGVRPEGFAGVRGFEVRPSS